jgi:chorismate dehydratase
MLLPDFSISSKSGVQSVLLFSKKPLAELKGARIALTWKGRTTPALLEIICRLRYGFFPEFLPMIEAPLDLVLKAADAALLIGDEALLERDSMDDDSLFVTDLALEWKEWTGLPIVFAVWAARRGFFNHQPEKVLAVRKSLLESRAWGMAHPERIVDEAERLSELPPKLLQNYFSCLSYDFAEDLQKGFSLFLNYAAECELLDSIRPLDFVVNPNEAGKSTPIHS